jgi:hypothetical protein
LETPRRNARNGVGGFDVDSPTWDLEMWQMISARGGRHEGHNCD